MCTGLAPQLNFRALDIGPIESKADRPAIAARPLDDVELSPRAADHDMTTHAAPAFLCRDASARDFLSPAALDRGQLPAIDHRQFAGCIDGARIGAIAVDQNAVAAAPPDRHRDRIDQLAQARGFVVRLSGERRGPAVEQPQNHLAGRRPSPFDRERPAAAQADRQREWCSVPL